MKGIVIHNLGRRGLIGTDRWGIIWFSGRWIISCGDFGQLVGRGFRAAWKRI